MQRNNKHNTSLPACPTLCQAILPVIALLASLIAIIVFKGAYSVQDYGYLTLLGASAMACAITLICTRRQFRHLGQGVIKSAKQVLPAIVVLIFIGTLSATWMLSGVVPAFIYYGLQVINPTWFLLTACAVSALVSVVTGSSWTTIATIGVAFLGMGTAMGYSAPWVAGAIISGAYFGDKVSPLSDTTVLASATCGVNLFVHIRYLMLTTAPAMLIAMLVYTIAGFATNTASGSHSQEMINAIGGAFNITPWILIIPGITCIMIAMRLRTEIILATGSVVGLIGMFILQPQVVDTLASGVSDTWTNVLVALRVLFTDSGMSVGNELLDPLLSTSGMLGMLPTIILVTSAMIFGGVMIGSGMLSTITHTITHRIARSRSLVSTTVCSGLFLNACTGDQYLSIIIGGNVYKNTYRKLGLKPQVLSRTLEDSVSVTSVLIPWNSCGITQSTILGVATLTYLPFCVFNYLSPIMSVIMAWAGYRLHAKPTTSTTKTAIAG